MVATSGPGWRLAPALVRLIDETDQLFPRRSQTSDGSIGDTAHSARTSDHNPDDGWVDAVDITDDDANGCDVALLAYHLVAKRDPRVGYLIHKGTIWRGYDKPGLPAFTPQPYTGPNAHDRHLHVSIDDDHRGDTAPWWPQAEPAPPIAPPEDDMSERAEQLIERMHKALGLSGLDDDHPRITQGNAVGRVGVLYADLLKGGDDVDEAKVAALVLAGLDPAAIASAIPDDIAEQVVNKLTERLAG